ncbi:MAG: EthD family reductase [Nitrososphaerota archaeon]|nr:EthD family reductase [Candidatus Geocrenenecus dongiae]
MLKVIQELKKKADISVEDFQQYVVKKYGKFLKTLPGLRSASVKFVQGGYQITETPIDCCVEMDFRNEETFKKAFESEDAKKILEELNNYVEKSVFLYLKEKALKKPVVKPAKKAKKKK